MNLITRNGPSSKNTPTDTYDSLLLAIHTDYIAGVEMNLNMTKDGKIIVYQTDAIDNHPNYKISDLTYTELQKFNLGSKVKKHWIITLEDVLKLFETTTKMLVLNLNNHGENNSIFTKTIFNLIDQYPNDNIYIKSSCKEIVLDMKGTENKAKIGAVIMNTEPYFWDLNLDFYSVSIQHADINECSKYIKKQMNNNRYIMMGDIDSPNLYENVKSSLSNDIMDKSYIITSNVVSLAQEYYQN